MTDKRYKIVYCTPALYMAGGVERVLTLKANYFADHFGYDITIILTDGKDKLAYYPLSEKIKVINLDINFEELWTCSFLKKVFIYLKKQRAFRKRLSQELMRIRPDITVSLLRREINFLSSIKDGSKKVGEMHINRANYRNFDAEETNVFKTFFSFIWSNNLLRHLKKLDKLIVLTQKDRESWRELSNVEVIPNPLSFHPKHTSPLSEKRVLAIARYSHEKGIDLLLQAWAMVEKQCKSWRLDVYGDGDMTSYLQQMQELGVDPDRCGLHGRTNDVEKEYCSSSIYVLSSRFEGFGIVILEAMACGLPVVSFDCPWGPQSIITSGTNGLLVDNGNVEALAEAIWSLVKDEEYRKKLAAAAIENVQRYDMDSISGQWKQLFDEIVV